MGVVARLAMSLGCGWYFYCSFFHWEGHWILGKDWNLWIYVFPILLRVFFVAEGEVGGEKGDDGVHTVGGIFLLTAFSVTEVVRF